MNKTKTIPAPLAPSAAPTPDEIRWFQALPRAEQERQLNLAVKAGFDAKPSKRSVDEIISEAHARATIDKHG